MEVDDNIIFNILQDFKKKEINPMQRARLIKNFRESNKWSQRQLAKYLDMSHSTLQDWEEWEGWFESGVTDGILAMCATVEEAIDVFKRYNLFTFQKVKFLVADKTGNSVVIEWSNEGLKFLERNDKIYQVSTNFITSNYKFENVPCYRYKVAASMFEDNRNAPSIDFLRGILSVTHLEFST